MIKILAPLHRADAYSRLAQEIAHSFILHHVPFQFQPLGLYERLHTPEWLAPHVSFSPDAQDLHVIVHTPDAFPSHRGTAATLGLCCWDTTKPPDPWITACQSLDLLLTPSEFMQEIFHKHQVHATVLAPPVPFSEQSGPSRSSMMTFTAIGSPNPRKNWLVLLQAFGQAFPTQRDVQIIFKCRPDLAHPLNYVSRDPRVLFIHWDWPDEQLISLYNSTDCLVYPSRAEAYGLPPREALWFGVPSILTPWGGLSDLMDCPGIVACSPGNPQPASLEAYLPSQWYGDIGYWCSPSVEHLAALLRQAYDRRDSLREQGRLGREWALDHQARKETWAPHFFEVLNRCLPGVCRGI